ncbi:ATP-binding protein [Pseudomonas sp. IT-P12]|uniref:hypothetical protein n=1 Tax=Pseudomonas sp. IT-P12 TaxID=3026450 RepID=UPI0039E07A20
MAVEWSQIRTFNNSQNSAFEELVCQLAREEEIPGRVSFYRVAAPDAGVEAYCVLDNGDEYGWQAKYFDSIGASQWAQIKKSFETALNTHPNLTKYYVCIPMDRSDPRRDKQKWFMDHWNSKTDEWKEIARQAGRAVEIVYWGSSELIHRLSRDVNSGRKLFWFSENEFSEKWFVRQISSSIKDLGRRYTPEANIELNINLRFEALTRSSIFKEHARGMFDELFFQLELLLKAAIAQPKVPLTKPVSKYVDIIKLNCAIIFESGVENIFWAGILSALNELNELIIVARDEVENAIHGEQKKHAFVRKLYMDTLRSIRQLVNFGRDSQYLTNSPYMLLTGDAGIGKSHLLGDFSTRKLKENCPGVLILGQHLTSEEAPWTQILRNILRLQCSEEELLGALNAQAESRGERLIFVVDAINEGRGKFFWEDHIHSFVESFKAFPWVGLVLSVRTSYVRMLQLDNAEVDGLIRVRHHGFAGHEDEASALFFSQYGIAKPSIPLLSPEFSNPLFLKLFCEGLKGKRRRSNSKDIGGISDVIDHYFESVNERLSAPSKFDYPVEKNLVKIVATSVVKAKLESGSPYVEYDAAYALTEELVSRFSNQRRFLDALISEGVLSKNAFWNKQVGSQEGVYLSYEKFEDHLLASYLVFTELDPDDVVAGFRGEGALAKFVNNPSLHQGVLESLSIQLPNRFGLELYEVLAEDYPHSKNIVEAFINSLVWRTPKTVKEESWGYIKSLVLSDHDIFDRFIQAVYSIVGDPEHYYNADSLHCYLFSMSMADRDEFWSYYINFQDDESSSIWRLVKWAINLDDKSTFSSDSKRLCAIALSWLFTSTNIKLRDSATKALTKLLINELVVARSLLELFKDVDDFYLLERLYASVYGAVVNSSDITGLDGICVFITDLVTNSDEFYPNVLVRDYARGVVEYGCCKGVIDKDVLVLVSPPYKSDFPEVFPSNEIVDAYAGDCKSEGVSGVRSILSSMVTEYGRGVGGYGDFGRYTFESALRNWECDSNLLSNYACELIFEKYGYTADKHGVLDKDVRSNDRYNNVVERIGKKYQWLALYEVVARLSDNKKMIDETSGRSRDNTSYVEYEGPWHPALRNIDPTMVSMSQTYDPNLCFWEKPEYNDWGMSNSEWLKASENLPDPKEIISIVDSDGVEWLALERYLSWKEPEFSSSYYEADNSKNLWYQCRSYLVRKDDSSKVVADLKNENFMGRWMPESKSQYQIFCREYYWSSAYRYFQKPYYGWSSWEKISSSITKKVIGSVQVTSEGHHWETGSDDDSQRSYLSLRTEIFHGLNLNYSSRVGEWLDSSGKLAAFDPAANGSAPSCLLVRKDLLIDYLRENNLDLFWSVLGQKTLFGGFGTGDNYARWLEVSGIYTFGESVVGDLRVHIKNTGRN